MHSAVPLQNFTHSPLYLYTEDTWQQEKKQAVYLPEPVWQMKKIISPVHATN
jgi:hypothetical protein